MAAYGNGGFPSTIAVAAVGVAPKTSSSCGTLTAATTVLGNDVLQVRWPMGVTEKPVAATAAGEPGEAGAVSQMLPPLLADDSLPPVPPPAEEEGVDDAKEAFLERRAAALRAARPGRRPPWLPPPPDDALDVSGEVKASALVDDAADDGVVLSGANGNEVVVLMVVVLLEEVGLDDGSTAASQASLFMERSKRFTRRLFTDQSGLIF